MQKRHYAQRQHIIYSLDTLLYQLHTVSFFLSPSLWSFALRLVCQFQCSKPRELDAARSLPFFFGLVIFFNISTLWNHTTQGAAEGRAVVLDFIGMAYVPSKAQLLILDFLIIFLQLLLTTIAYETSIVHTAPADSIDTLLPIPSTPSSPISTPLVINDNTKQSPPPHESAFVLDLRLAPILHRLRNSPPPLPPSRSDDLLPLPNTTQWPFPANLRMLMRAREMRRRPDDVPLTNVTTNVDGGATGNLPRRIPGGLE